MKSFIFDYILLVSYQFDAAENEYQVKNWIESIDEPERGGQCLVHNHYNSNLKKYRQITKCLDLCFWQKIRYLFKLTLFSHNKNNRNKLLQRPQARAAGRRAGCYAMSVCGHEKLISLLKTPWFNNILTRLWNWNKHNISKLNAHRRP